MKKTYDKLRSIVLENLGIEHTATGDLLDLYFAEDTVPASLAAFFSKYDIELLEYPCVWLVSKLASRLHYEGLPKEQFPRIKGIVKRFTVENGRSFCVLPDILEGFNNAGIAVMLLNGAAMKVYYEPDETRYQNDINMLVHAGNLKKAEVLLKERGFCLQGTFWEQRVYQKNDVRIVLHSTYLRASLLTGDLADIWQHFREISWVGKKAFVPCPEMLLLILLAQGLEACCVRIQDVRNNCFVNCFLDSKFFLDYSPLDWDKFTELAKKCRLALHARLMLDILDRLYPGSAPEYVLDALPFTDKDVANVQRLVSYSIAKKQVMAAKARRDRMGCYYNGMAALWDLNCYYGNRSSLVSNICDFPRFISVWNGNRGIKGLLSRLASVCSFIVK